MGTFAVRREPSGVGSGVGVKVGVGVDVGVAVSDGAGLGAGVEVSGAVAVGDGVEVAVGVGVEVAVDVGLAVGVAVAVGVGVPNKPAAGPWFHTSASGDDPASGDNFNPSCTTVSRSNRMAKNQKRAIARKAEVMVIDILKWKWTHVRRTLRVYPARQGLSTANSPPSGRGGGREKP